MGGISFPFGNSAIRSDLPGGFLPAGTLHLPRHDLSMCNWSSRHVSCLQNRHFVGCGGKNKNETSILALSDGERNSHS